MTRIRGGRARLPPSLSPPARREPRPPVVFPKGRLGWTPTSILNRANGPAASGLAHGCSSRRTRAAMTTPELAVAEEAARAAAAVLKRHFRAGVVARSKDVANLVTDADVEAERAVVEVIRRHFPAHDIL